MLSPTELKTAGYVSDSFTSGGKRTNFTNLTTWWATYKIKDAVRDSEEQMTEFRTKVCGDIRNYLRGLADLASCKLCICDKEGLVHFRMTLGCHTTVDSIFMGGFEVFMQLISRSSGVSRVCTTHADHVDVLRQSLETFGVPDRFEVSPTFLGGSLCGSADIETNRTKLAERGIALCASNKKDGGNAEKKTVEIWGTWTIRDDVIDERGGSSPKFIRLMELCEQLIAKTVHSSNDVAEEALPALFHLSINKPSKEIYYQKHLDCNNQKSVAATVFDEDDPDIKEIMTELRDDYIFWKELYVVCPTEDDVAFYEEYVTIQSSKNNGGKIETTSVMVAIE